MKLRIIATSIVTTTLLSGVGCATASATAMPTGTHAVAAAAPDNPIWDDTPAVPTHP